MIIEVNGLRRDFIRKYKVKSGLFPRYAQETVPAVRDISFSIPAGQRVAFIGPNGAGKSTTLKMLSGLMDPSAGTAQVAGFVPWEQRQNLAWHIGLVFGQRSQLWHHLPVRHSFDLLGRIYGVPEEDYNKQCARLVEQFKLQQLIDQPVKSLSLGQRMRCEIAASLLHSPKILFLDEPTIGLDVEAKADLRDHLRQLCTENGTTIILTSHDTTDIEEICERVILINNGTKLIDTSLENMRRDYMREKEIIFHTEDEHPQLTLPDGTKINYGAHTVNILVDPTQISVAQIMKLALDQLHVRDVVVNNMPLEAVIRQIYAEQKL